MKNKAPNIKKPNSWNLGSNINLADIHDFDLHGADSHIHRTVLNAMGPSSLPRFRQLRCENMTQTSGYWSTLTVSNHESAHLAAGASLQTSVLITDEQCWYSL